jgi:hypothetical protein
VLLAAFVVRAKDHAADAAEPVDGYLDRHVSASSTALMVSLSERASR